MAVCHSGDLWVGEPILMDHHNNKFQKLVHILYVFSKAPNTDRNREQVKGDIREFFADLRRNFKDLTESKDYSLYKYIEELDPDLISCRIVAMAAERCLKAGSDPCLSLLQSKAEKAGIILRVPDSNNVLKVLDEMERYAIDEIIDRLYYQADIYGLERMDPEDVKRFNGAKNGFWVVNYLGKYIQFSRDNCLTHFVEKECLLDQQGVEVHTITEYITALRHSQLYRAKMAKEKAEEESQYAFYYERMEKIKADNEKYSGILDMLEEAQKKLSE